MSTSVSQLAFSARWFLCRLRFCDMGGGRFVCAFTPWGDVFLPAFLFHVADATDYAWWNGFGLWRLPRHPGYFLVLGIDLVKHHSPTFTPILTALRWKIRLLFAAGTALPNIINRELTRLRCLVAEDQPSLCWSWYFCSFCNSRRAKDIAKISIVPGIFGINEPVIRTTDSAEPWLWQFLWFSTPAINIMIGVVCHEYWAGASVQRHYAAWKVRHHWSRDFLCGWQGALLQLVLIALDMCNSPAKPFIKALTTQFPAEEEGGEPEVVGLGRGRLCLWVTGCLVKDRARCLTVFF